MEIITDFITNDGSRLQIIKCNDQIDKLIRKLNNFDNYEEEFKKLSTDKRRREFLCIRIALNELMGTNVIVIYNKSGKPFLKDLHQNISLSHSKNWIAILINSEKQVGIDLEHNSERIKAIMTRFLSTNEQLELNSSNDIRKLQIAWSAKEALYKIIGKEAYNFKKNLKIHPFEISNTGSFKAEYLPDNEFFNLSYMINDEFNVVYCSK